MPKAIRIHENGGPEVMRWEEVAVPDPGPGEVRLRHTAVGLNFIDVYHRTGLYKLPLPAGLGQEGAGVVEAVGAGVDFLKPGDRVAYCGAGAPAAYCEVRNAPADRMVPLPADIDDRAAAAMMLKGLTAWYLLRRTYGVQAGDTILVHAAAGGVGLILCQWAAHLGATVIGTAGSRAKADLAAAHGCHHPLVLGEDDFVAKARALTGGRGLPVVYDSVGRDTFLASLDCLRPRGLMVSFGQSSGPVPPMEVTLLSAKGSLYLTRPSLFAYVAERAELLAAAEEMFNLVRSGILRIEVNQTYPLRDAAEAHRDLEGRKTTGSTVLIP
jgi:NADPH2:quinone reductase